MPRRSAFAVPTTSTRESGSSTQSTGTSWIRRPLCSASTSSSVSKNQPRPRPAAAAPAPTSVADRLEPALRVGEPAAQRRLEQQVVGPRDGLALRPARPPASRRPAGCRWRRRCGPTAAAPRAAGARRGRSRGRRPCRRRPASARRPRRAQRPTAALLRRGGRPARRPARSASRQAMPQVRVGAGVVGDRDQPRQREALGEVGVQAADRRFELRRLVVDRDHDLDHREPAPLGIGPHRQLPVGDVHDVHAGTVHDPTQPHLRPSWEFAPNRLVRPPHRPFFVPHGPPGGALSTKNRTADPTNRSSCHATIGGAPSTKNGPTR